MRLFNLKKDPLEMNDLIGNPEYTSTVQKLKKAFVALQVEMGDTLNVENPSKPVRRDTKKNGNRKKS